MLDHRIRTKVPPGCSASKSEGKKKKKNGSLDLARCCDGEEKIAWRELIGRMPPTCHAATAARAHASMSPSRPERNRSTSDLFLIPLVRCCCACRRRRRQQRHNFPTASDLLAAPWPPPPIFISAARYEEINSNGKDFFRKEDFSSSFFVGAAAALQSQGRAVPWDPATTTTLCSFELIQPEIGADPAGSRAGGGSSFDGQVWGAYGHSRRLTLKLLSGLAWSRSA